MAWAVPEHTGLVRSLMAVPGAVCSVLRAGTCPGSWMRSVEPGTGGSRGSGGRGAGLTMERCLVVRVREQRVP